MSGRPQLLDQNGHPISSMQTAHYAAERDMAELAAWNPQSYSADGEWLPEKDIVGARAHDLIRNNGMVNGGVQLQIDNLVGAGLRLSAKPNWEALGITDLDYIAAWEDRAEALFCSWADDIDCYCDAARQLSFGGMISQGCRTYFTSFEILATGEWLPRRGSKWSTAIQMIDPLRLSNPDARDDDDRLRAGVVFDRMGAPVGYHIASRVPEDPFSSFAREMVTWKFVLRETPRGRRLVIHVFEQERAGQSRGKGGMVSVLARGKMLDRNEQVHLQAAIQNAMFATVVTSPMDWQRIGQALGANNEDDVVLKYLQNKATFHKDAHIRFGGTKIPHMYPGEDLKHLQASHPHASFESFERIFHRYMAAGLNMTYEQFSRDYSQTNYSGHRAALLDYWRFITGRRSHIAGRFASLIYALWLEEAMDSGEVETPAGAPSFLEAKTAWCGAEWIGPGRGQIDPLKEANATKVEDAMGLTTMEIECAERGRDYKKVMRQRAYEAKWRRDLAAKMGIDEKALRDDGPTPVQQPPDQPERDANGKRTDGMEEDNEDGGAPEGNGAPRSAARTPEELDAIQARIESYGVAVRAGLVTPQPEDEDSFRSDLGLPVMTPAAKDAWAKDGGVRRPITLREAPKEGAPASSQKPEGATA